MENTKPIQTDPALQKDIDACWKELEPILDKYNLDVGAVWQMARNALVAVPELRRPLKKEDKK